MSLMVPSEVRTLFLVLTGDQWPSADEDQLFLLADAWDRAAGRLGSELGPELAEAVNKIRREFRGKAALRFADRMAPYVVEPPYYVDTAVQRFKALAALLRQTALQVQYVKYVSILSLIELLAEIAWAVAMAGPTFGGSMTWLAARIPVVRFLLERWWGQLLMRILEAQIVGIALQVGIDVAAQGLQFLTNPHKTSWDAKSTITSIEIGALGGALSLPLSALSGLLGNALGKTLVKRLGNDIDPKILENAAKHAAEKHAHEFPTTPMAKFADAVGETIDNYAGMSVRGMWADKVGKGFAETLEESLHEYLTEGMYNVMTGKANPFGNPFGLTAGLASGLSNRLGGVLGAAKTGNLTPPPGPALTGAAQGADTGHQPAPPSDRGAPAPPGSAPPGTRSVTGGSNDPNLSGPGSSGLGVNGSGSSAPGVNGPADGGAADRGHVVRSERRTGRGDPGQHPVNNANDVAIGRTARDGRARRGNRVLCGECVPCGKHPGDDATERRGYLVAVGAHGCVNYGHVAAWCRRAYVTYDACAGRSGRQRQRERQRHGATDRPDAVHRASHSADEHANRAGDDIGVDHTCRAHDGVERVGADDEHGADLERVRDEHVADHCDADHRDTDHRDVVHCDAVHCDAHHRDAHHRNAQRRDVAHHGADLDRIRYEHGADHCDTDQRDAVHCDADNGCAVHCDGRCVGGNNRVDGTHGGGDRTGDEQPEYTGAINGAAGSRYLNLDVGAGRQRRSWGGAVARGGDRRGVGCPVAEQLWPAGPRRVRAGERGRGTGQPGFQFDRADVGEQRRQQRGGLAALRRATGVRPRQGRGRARPGWRRAGFPLDDIPRQGRPSQAGPCRGAVAEPHDGCGGQHHRERRNAERDNDQPDRHPSPDRRRPDLGHLDFGHLSND